jgi:hypothetical protein
VIYLFTIVRPNGLIPQVQEKLQFVIRKSNKIHALHFSLYLHLLTTGFRKSELSRIVLHPIYVILQLIWLVQEHSSIYLIVSDNKKITHEI